MILAFDSTGPTLSVAAGTAESFVTKSIRDHSGVVEHLFPLLEELCGHRLSEVSSVAVCLGPGSYTGTRSGMSAALAIGFGREIPVIGLSVFAGRLLGDPSGVAAGRYGVIMPANRAELFAAVRTVSQELDHFQWSVNQEMTVIRREEEQPWIDALEQPVSIIRLEPVADTDAARFAGLGADYVLRAASRLSEVGGLEPPDIWLSERTGLGAVWYGKEFTARTLHERGFGLVQFDN